mmetsp:Transcript_92541/g.241089  ORF Transcript_92541/g.241089 Transcript_92541/m.241089 type:complete len:207 (-) Transcript_92541:46-666(-)
MPGLGSRFARSAGMERSSLAWAGETNRTSRSTATEPVDHLPPRQRSGISTSRLTRSPAPASQGGTSNNTSATAERSGGCVRRRRSVGSTPQRQGKATAAPTTILALPPGTSSAPAPRTCAVRGQDPTPASLEFPKRACTAMASSAIERGRVTCRNVATSTRTGAAPICASSTAAPGLTSAEATCAAGASTRSSTAIAEARPPGART